MAAPKLPDAGDPNSVYLVDVSSFVFRAYHAMPPLSNSKGEPTHAVAGVNQMLQRLIDERKPTRVVVAMDPKGGSFRNQLYDKYKANRPEAPPDLSSQIEWVKKLCVAWGFLVVEQVGYEADDLIATTVKRARSLGMHTVIVSADKDLLQLVGDDVVMWDTMKNKVFGREETIERLGVPPEKVRDMLALVGDASDNVPGVPSVGPKTAQKLLEEFGTLDGVFASLEKIKAKGTREKLTAHRADAELSRELVTLADDVPVEFDLFQARFEGGHPEELRAIYVELELVRALAQSEPRKQAAVARYGLCKTIDDVKTLARGIREAGEVGVHTIVDGNDPHRGLVLGLALSWGEGVASYVPFVPGQLGDEVPNADETLAVLRPVLENSLLPKLAGDWKRERLALHSAGVDARGVDLDVSLASYLLDPDRNGHDVPTVARLELDAELPTDESLLGKGAKAIRESAVPLSALGDFACARADYALRLARILRPRLVSFELDRLYRELELPLIDVLVRMEETGMTVDLALLSRLSAETQKELERIEAECFSIVGHSFNVGSPKQLEGVLFDELGLRVVKKTKTGRSTDAEVLEELAAEHPLPASILEFRSLAKLKGTYLDALPLTVDPRTGRIHTHYEQAVAATGRISSTDPNLQNIPIRTELGQRIRTAFVPGAGLTLMSADYSQIELRVLAHLSHDAELVDAYSRGDDVHRRTASALFGVPVDAVSKDQRAAAKTVNFAVIYGQTEFALARNLKISREEARRYIDAFFAKYAGVKKFLDDVVEDARAKGHVTTLFGRKRTVADIHSRNPMLRAAAERVARNTPIQGTAADLIKRAMIAIDRSIRNESLASRMLLTVHDELVIEAPESERPKLEAIVREGMSSAASLDVPLEVSVGWGRSWGEAH